MPQGTNQPRSRRPRLDDVARRAGVSIGTASNALNHPDRVAPRTLERVSAAIAELGFTRNSLASALAAGSTRTLGLVVIDLMNSLFVDIARGAQEAARNNRFDLQLADSDNSAEQQLAHIRFLERARVAGFILAPVFETNDVIAAMRDRHEPLVLVNYRADDVDCCTVVVDNEAVGYLATRHLIEQGRRRVALVGGSSSAQPVVLRRAGVLRAIAETNGAVRLQEVHTTDLNPPSGSQAGAALAALPPDTRPDAVLAVTDLLAMAIISEFVAHGIRVPDDVAVMGCDHNSVAWGGAMPLTSVTMEGQPQGRAAVDLLLREIRDMRSSTPHTHETVVLQPSLVVRESTVGRA
ncbi:LacI family DNA-binding transcriptional regulator [Curtobacterium ammoniigenes]|uniref:LacI family DNA-binding transcriptional regulator n=1 Tax=Curtobacterium ammoniigenes TaxID=395387 RepID=UPI00083315DD|nr:LacI family DNA-binding transcriptional regulator [Curtobacterium ammoniigenes]